MSLKWKLVKQKGSPHYKGTLVEPIDLIKEGGMLRAFAISNIIKYAYRNRPSPQPINKRDIDKIIHYAEMLLSD